MPRHTNRLSLPMFMAKVQAARGKDPKTPVEQFSQGVSGFPQALAQGVNETARTFNSISKLPNIIQKPLNNLFTDNISTLEESKPEAAKSGPLAGISNAIGQSLPQTLATIRSGRMIQPLLHKAITSVAVPTAPVAAQALTNFSKGASQALSSGVAANAQAQQQGASQSQSSAQSLLATLLSLAPGLGNLAGKFGSGALEEATQNRFAQR